MKTKKAKRRRMQLKFMLVIVLMFFSFYFGVKFTEVKEKMIRAEMLDESLDPIRAQAKDEFLITDLGGGRREFQHKRLDLTVIEMRLDTLQYNKFAIDSIFKTMTVYSRKFSNLLYKKEWRVGNPDGKIISHFLIVAIRPIPKNKGEVYLYCCQSNNIREKHVMKLLETFRVQKVLVRPQVDYKIKPYYRRSRVKTEQVCYI